MRTAIEKLRLLIVGLALSVAQQGQPAAAEAPSGAEPEVSEQPVAAETEPIPAQTEFLLPETQLVFPGLATYSKSPAPTWYFLADGLALKRNASGDQSFAHTVTRVWTQVGDPPVWEFSDSDTMILGTQALDFDFRGGVRGLIGRTLGDWHAIEFSYFGLNSWNQSAAVTVSDAPPFEITQGVFVAPTLLSPFTDFHYAPVPGLDDNNLVSISYSSDLDNFEWNLRRTLAMPPGRLQASVLVGGRYMCVGETFIYHSESDVPAPLTTNDVTTRTANEMLGVQIGALFSFHVEPRWWVDCEIKGAIFDNRADQDTLYVNNSGEVPYDGTHVGSHSENGSAFALDLCLTFTYQVTPYLSARVGYQALWLDGLALASENFNRNVDILVAGPAALVDSGHVVYHGPHIGVTWAR